MSGWTSADRADFLQQLSQAGWEVQEWQTLRDEGVRVDLTAEAQYAGPHLGLRLEMPAGRRCLLLHLLQLDGEPLFSLLLYPAVDLTAALAPIVAMQNTLDSDNHPDLVKSLMPLCNPLQIETSEGIFSLSQPHAPSGT